MVGLIGYLARYIDRKKNAGRQDLGLVSLESARTVVLFMDGFELDANEIISKIKSFFSERGVKVFIYALNFDKKQYFAEGVLDARFIRKNNINWYGRIKKKADVPEIRKDCDIFINLINKPRYFIEREAFCSSAVMKISRFQHPYYNIVVEDKPEETSSQMEIFGAIADLIQKIK